MFLNKGSYGSVYSGFWKEKEVAIRRINATDCQETWKDVVDKHLKGKLSHENVLKIIDVEEDISCDFTISQLVISYHEQVMYYII